MMRTPFETTFNRLQYSTRVKGRQLLHELEASPEELTRFCHHAANLSAARAELLCPILAGMITPEYLDLLRQYALRSEPPLREAAIEALRSANPSARRKAVYALLSAPDESLRQDVCALLGAENTHEAGRQLVTMLRQDSAAIIATALDGLKHIPIPDAASECERLLTHPDRQVRLLAVQVLEELNTVFPAAAILKLLKSDPDLGVRLQTCKSLVRHPNPEAIPLLIILLNDAPRPRELRLEAAKTLAHYPDPSAAQSLFLAAITPGADSALRQICLQSLLRQPQPILLELCRTFLNSDDPNHRREAAAICGKIDDHIANALLSNRLEIESDPLVSAALLEEAGNSGAIGVWDVAMEKVKDSQPLVAYLAVQTLAKLLIPPKLREFAKLLNTDSDNYIIEVTLERLGAFARVRGLPEETRNLILPFLSHPYSNIAILAAEAVCTSNDDTTILTMLEALDPGAAAEKQFALCRGLLSSASGSLKRLLDLAGEDHLLKIAAILSRMEEVQQGECEEEYFRTLADAAGRNVPFARLCLILAACLKPRGLIAAFNSTESAELYSLLQVWQALPEINRLSVPVPWNRLFSFPNKKMKLLTLSALPPTELPRQIGILTEIALTDANPEIASVARQRLRESLAQPLEKSDAL